MALRDQIELAAVGLMRLKNADGGMPAVRAEHSSGCWTSAITVHSLLSIGALPVNGIGALRDVIEYLLNSQIVTEGEKGGWPLAQGERGSAMATGHSCAALQRAMRMFDYDPALTARLKSSVAIGKRWLTDRQNDDGGWGPEPAAGGEGKASSILATGYALLPFIESGETSHTPGVVQEASRYLGNRRHGSDGSWSYQFSLPGDVSTSARAVVTLLRCRACTPQDHVARGALAFILSKKDPKSGLWDVVEEPVFYPDAGGNISFHQNALGDVLTFFAEIGYRGPEVGYIVSWLLATQDKTTGLWPLASPNWRAKEVETWSTCTWALALDIASRKLGDTALEGTDLSAAKAIHRKLRLPMVAVLSVSMVSLLGFTSEALYRRIVLSYNWLPGWAKWIIATLIVGGIVSALSDGVKGGVKSALRWASSRPIAK